MYNFLRIPSDPHPSDFSILFFPQIVLHFSAVCIFVVNASDCPSTLCRLVSDSTARPASPWYLQFFNSPEDPPVVLQTCLSPASLRISSYCPFSSDVFRASVSAFPFALCISFHNPSRSVPSPRNCHMSIPFGPRPHLPNPLLVRCHSRSPLSSAHASLFLSSSRLLGLVGNVWHHLRLAILVVLSDLIQSHHHLILHVLRTYFQESRHPPQVLVSFPTSDIMAFHFTYHCKIANLTWLTPFCCFRVHALKLHPEYFVPVFFCCGSRGIVDVSVSVFIVLCQVRFGRRHFWPQRAHCWSHVITFV